MRAKLFLMNRGSWMIYNVEDPLIIDGCLTCVIARDTEILKNWEEATITSESSLHRMDYYTFFSNEYSIEFIDRRLSR